MHLCTINIYFKAKNYHSKLFMSSYDIKSSRATRAIDNKSQRTKRLLPYLTPVRGYHSQQKPKKRKHNHKTQMETHVRRYEQNQSITVLSIRFASADVSGDANEDSEEAYIKAQKNKMESEVDATQEEENNSILPFLKYKRYESPEQQLRSMGYDPDVRVPSEVYSDKVEERKERYLNKMQAMKKELENTSADRRQNRLERCKIQVRILGEQIRRKRERDLLKNEDRKAKKMFQSLLMRAEQD